VTDRGRVVPGTDGHSAGVCGRRAAPRRSSRGYAEEVRSAGFRFVSAHGSDARGRCARAESV